MSAGAGQGPSCLSTEGKRIRAWRGFARGGALGAGCRVRRWVPGADHSPVGTGAPLHERTRRIGGVA
jgi:hypothetical protein